MGFRKARVLTGAGATTSDPAAARTMPIRLTLKDLPSSPATKCFALGLHRFERERVQVVAGKGREVHTQEPSADEGNGVDAIAATRSCNLTNGLPGRLDLAHDPIAASPAYLTVLGNVPHCRASSHLTSFQPSTSKFILRLGE